MSDVHLVRLECGNANAIDEALLKTIVEGLRTALDSGKNAVVLTGYEKYFSAGLNLKSLPDSRDGMASFAELQLSYPFLTDSMFMDIDTDGDGFINDEEMAIALQLGNLADPETDA